MKLFVAVGMTLIVFSGVKAQSVNDVVGTWSCPNFTVTIRAEGNGYLLHAKPHRASREYNVFGPFKDGRLEHTNSQIGAISYLSATKQLSFDGEMCTR